MAVCRVHGSTLRFTDIDIGMCSIMRLMPTDELLEICPLQTIQGVFGCISQREVAERRVDFQSKSIVNIAPNTPEELTNISTNAGRWLQGILGSSDFSRDLGYNHSMIMNKRYNLNARYRSGFMISPTVPWRQAELDRLEIRSILELAQFSISVVMLSLDTNIGDEYVSAMPGYTSVPQRRLLQQRLQFPERKTVSRMMLTVNSARPPADNKDSVVETSTREITSINNYDNVARAVCDPHYPNCELMTMKKSVSIADFCLSERMFLQTRQSDIAAAFIASSQDTVPFFQITSVLKIGFETACKTNSRRLLQNKDVQITFAVATAGAYVLALDVLRASGFGDVTLLSQTPSLLKLCDTTDPGSCIVTLHGPTGAQNFSIDITRNNNVAAEISAPVIGMILGSVCLFLVCFGLFACKRNNPHVNDHSVIYDDDNMHDTYDPSAMQMGANAQLYSKDNPWDPHPAYADLYKP